VRLSGVALEDHVAEVGDRLERFGAVLDPHDELRIRESPRAGRWFEIRAHLPDEPLAPPATVVVRELWRPVLPDLFERTEYEYELLDPARDVRRAWHLHDPDFFVERYRVVVHEHCERPIGAPTCHHYAGLPVRDAFAAVELLLDAWLDPQEPDCSALVCLDEVAR
jgi:hypothetical protein